MYTEELKTFYLLHCCPVNVYRGVFPLLSTIIYFVLLTLSEWLTPHSDGPHLLPVGCLVVVGNQAYHCCDVCKLHD